MLGQPPSSFSLSTTTLLSQTKESLHSIFWGGETENALHWQMRDFEWIQQPKRKCKKRCIRTNSGNYFLLSPDPQLFHLSETEGGASLLLLEFPIFPDYFMFRQAFQNSSVSISCSMSHPSVPEMKLVFLMSNFLFLLWRWWAIFPSTVSNLDKIAHIPRLYSLYQISNMFRNVSMFAHGNWG